jgi:hypothetical protein
MPKAAPKSHRISARLAPNAYRMIEELSSLTGETLSQVLENAIETHHQAVLANRQDPWKILQESGLIASAAGNKNLSTTYKSQLTLSLTRKHAAPKPRRKS